MLTAVERGAPTGVTGLSVSSAAPVRMEGRATTSLEIVPALLGGRWVAPIDEGYLVIKLRPERGELSKFSLSRSVSHQGVSQSRINILGSFQNHMFSHIILT